jgi:hypothetical protein
MTDHQREPQERTEAFVRVQLYEEIWKGTLPGYLRVLAEISGGELEPDESKDRWWRVRRWLLLAIRYLQIARLVGWGGLVFMNWLKRTFLRASHNEWTIFMNTLEEGRSWLHDEIARVFRDSAPIFLATLTGSAHVRSRD